MRNTCISNESLYNFQKITTPRLKMSKTAIELKLNRNIESAFVKKFPQLLDKTFETLTEQEKQQMKDFFQQEFIDSFTEIKSMDNTYSPTDFYRKLSLIYHPDKIKFNKVLLGDIPFQTLSEVCQNLTIHLSLLIHFHQLDPYDLNWPITNQILQFNQMRIKELNSYAIGRFFITLKTILLKFPVSVIQVILAIPVILTTLLKIFIFTSNQFNFNELTKEYIIKRAEQRAQKYMPNTLKLDPMQANHFINICIEIQTLHLAKSASPLPQNSLKAFEIFEQFIELYKIPGIHPKKEWTFDYVYQTSFQYLTLINHLKLHYPHPASATLKEYIETLLTKHGYIIPTFDFDYPQYTINDICSILIHFGSAEDKKFLDILKKKEEEDLSKIEVEALLFGKFEDRLHAYASKWQELKETYAKMSDTDKNQAIFKWLGLGIVVFVHESASAILYFINNIAEITLQVLSAILLILISLPIKLVEACQKAFEPQAQSCYQLVCAS